MKLSILVPTFNRNELLELGILSSLARQDVKTDYEVIVLNEGAKENEGEVQDIVYKYNNTRYIFTGQRNEEGLKWRIPGYAINIGAKLALGDSIIITCPEMYLPDNDLLRLFIDASVDDKRLVVTRGLDDQSGNVLAQAKDGYSYLDLTDNRTVNLNTDFPFFLLVNRKRFIDIGGYDEDFIGYCWDDLDIVDRLIRSGCYYHKIERDVVHLYHPRLSRVGITEKSKMWIYNKKLYYDRIGQNERNIGKDWGKYDRIKKNIH